MRYTMDMKKNKKNTVLKVDNSTMGVKGEIK